MKHQARRILAAVLLTASSLTAVPARATNAGEVIGYMDGEAAAICAHTVPYQYYCYQSYFSGAAGYWGGQAAAASGQLMWLTNNGFCSNPAYYAECAYWADEASQRGQIASYAGMMAAWAEFMMLSSS